MDSLSDVIACCRGLLFEKITERKKSSEKFRQLLCKSTVIKALDRHTDSKNCGSSDEQLTWDYVFKSVGKYVLIETQHLQKSKDQVSAATLTRKEKAKKEVSDLVKFVIRQADKRGPRLKCSSLLNHIDEILQDEYMCQAYGLDYSNVLLKNVLSVRKYWTEISSPTWHNLIGIYVKMYTSQEYGIDKMLLSRVISTLISGATVQCDLRPKRLLNFFTEVFKNIRQEKTLVVTENLICALNVFIKHIATNSRTQICKLGETVFVNMLYLWDNRPTPLLKNELIEFLSIQIHAHHPGGSKRDSVGAFAVDWDVWMSHLRKLYEVMYGDFQQLGGRKRFSTGSREASLPPNYVDLAAEVCNQLFQSSEHAIEVTQISETDIEDRPGAKKRRLESGWTSIRDIITSLGQTVQLTPWLQLITRVMEKFPGSLAEDETYPYLNCISSLISECKKVEISKYLLSCADAFTINWKKIRLGQRTEELCGPVWRKVWMSTLRCVSLHHATPEGYKLLKAMVLEDIIRPDRDMWSLFLPNISPPTQEAVEFLLCILQKFSLPEQFQPSVLTSANYNELQYPLRSQLIDWILPSGEGFSGSSLANNSDINPESVANVLVLLMIQNQSVLNRSEHCEISPSITDLEMTYLQSSHDFPVSNKFLSSKDSMKICNDVLHLSVVMSKIEKMLKDEVSVFLEISDVQLQHIEKVVSNVCLLSKLIYWLLSYGVVNSESLLTMDIVSLLKVLYKKLGLFLSEILQKEGCLPLQDILTKIQSLYSSEIYDGTSSIQAARLIRCLLPSKIVDQLLGIASNKLSKQPRASHSKSDIGHIKLKSRNRPSSSRSIIEDDDMDLEFDQPLAKDQGEEEDLDDDFGDSQDAEESNVDAFQSPLSSSSLTEGQTLRLTAIKVLCGWCAYDKPEMKEILPLETNADPVYIRTKMEELIDEEELDSNKAFDLQMLQVIISGLTTSNHQVGDLDLENMVDAIRRVAKQQRKDHNISCMCLELLSSVVCYLGNDEMPSKTVKECREITVHLLSAFWNLQDTFSSKVRLTTAKCMMAFIEADPKQQWALLSTKEDESAISTEFIQTMCDLSHDVRMYASQAVSRLYVTGCEEPIPINRHQQNQLFDQIYVIINETIDIKSKQGSLTAERAQDEKNNRTASALTTVGNIMCSSVVCENKTIFALCQLVRECDIDIKQVHNVLKKVSSLLGYKDGHHYMSYHLPYVLNQWLGLNYPVAEFPYQLAFCSSLQNFYRDFYLVIIPQLIMKKNILDAKEVVTEIKGSWDIILRQCIPHTVIYMLPLFAVADTGNAPSDETLKKRTAHATACYDLLTREATKEVVEKTIVSCLDEIVVNILKCLYDPEEDFVKTGSIRNIDPEPNPPCYNPYMIRCTLDYVTNSFSGNARTLVDVLSKNQDSIQKILLDISVKLNTEHRLHEKRRLFLMYQLFVKLLLREFSQQLGGSWAYVLRETIHRLVYTANDVIKIYQNGISDCGYSKNIIFMSLQLLKEICTVGLETCPEELSKYLPFIVGNIVKMATSDAEDIANEANLLLQLLIIDNFTSLRHAIVSLDPFPSEEKFHQLSTLHRRLKYADGPFTLIKEINHFMSSASSVCNVRKEGLEHLSQQLHQNRKQLCQFTSHDTEKESICQLICKLVQVYQGAKGEVTVEISKCLGEIGPVDLEQNGLPRVEDTVDQVVSLFTGNQQNYCKIFHMLNQYLVDNDMSVVEAASNVLKTLLSTKTGIEFANLYRERLGDKDFLFQYLHPFRPRKKIQAGKEESVSVEEFQRMVDMETMWTPPDCSHDNWIHNLTCTLINAGVQDEILSRLQPICMIKTRFSEIVLPLVIHDLLVQDQPIHREVLSSHIRRFFSSHCEQDSSNPRSHSALSMSSRDVSEVCRNKDSLRSMLNVVQYLRQQDRPKQGRQEMTAWDNNFWLDLDFLHISKAAMYCSAHFSAILFAEIWCDIQRQKQDYSGDSQKGTGFSQSFSQTTMIDSLGSSTSSSSTINVQDLLLQTYQEIGDPDGLYGCGAGRLADTSSRVKSYEHENRWEKAVITYDIEMCQPSSVPQYELLQALQNFGSNHLLERYLHTMSSTGQSEIPNHIKDLQFKAAWKTGQWNIETTSRLEESCSFNEAVYSALTAVKDGHCSLAERNIGIARMLSMQKISTSTMESARCLYPILADLQCVSQIDNVLQYNILKKEGYDDLTTRWNSEDSFTDNDFMFLEPTLNIRCTILKMLQLKHDDPSLNICLQHQLLKLAQLARESNRHQIAERAIFDLKQMETDDLKLYIPKLIEEANLYWTRQEQNTAKHLMKNLMTKLEKLQDENIDAARFYPQVLSIYGNWLAETRSENPNVIMEEYLEKTVGLLESLNEQGDVAMDAYLSLARYADNQYQNIVNYMKSNTYEAKQALMKKAKTEMETLKQLGDISKDRYYKILYKQSDIDKAEIEAMNEDKTKYLQKAVENYLKCLKYGDKHDLRIFRLISLWFSNTAVQDVNTLIEKSIKTLKSYKFIPLMYQLAARMDTKAQSQSFQATLNNMIERAAKDHPHHTLLCVLALAHAKKDTEIMNPTTASTNRRTKLSKSISDTSKDEGRIEAAKLMLLRLKDKNSPVVRIVEDLEKLCLAYIQLANVNVERYKKETRPIQLQSVQNNLLITKIKDLHNVAVPTVDIKVDPKGSYNNLICVKGFNPTFKLAGGVNLPKIISCIGTDGKTRRQLVKGRDDLRQDAVMQQVFGMVNNLLQKNSETRKRQLHVRQYKVVPLSQMSGLLEWCEGTMPIGEYLVASSPGDEKPGAHYRYRPDDYPAIDCRRHMGGVHASPDAVKKFKVFMAVCKRFLPVFRHFFMEKFRDPAVWFEARLAYTKSVATNSIVGYILGLGDRHVQNILIDCNTAELVHIDLGVAFEQGKILPTPETVPFRLTRDIVDGMGVSGVEGVFRRCCEKTMDVMHNNQEALLTILEVLLYDPLYAWCMSPAKAYALQHRRDRNDPDASELNTTKDVLEFAESNEPVENTESVNKLAERVLLRLHQKLQGIEDGVQLSVSGQVNLLIQQARDPKNLAKLFPGWQPYI
ncbi:serine-protein kinase ATM-like [Mytilus trossulus]|uniref:serine-protein kinase ATM-like n=1 Tax=Mytilus trossulus TaxID=6551 RepID=UPI003004E4E6